MGGENQDKFFDLLEKMIDRAFTLEKRLQQVEFRSSIIWWGLTALVVSIALPLALHTLQILISKLMG